MGGHCSSQIVIDGGGRVQCASVVGPFDVALNASTGVRRVVFVDAAQRVLVFCLHDVLDQRTGIDLQVGVPAFCVKGIGIAVALVVGVQAVGCLPFVGDAILVGIEAVRTTAGGEGSLGISVAVGHQVDESRFLGDSSHICSSTAACLVSITFVHLVAVERCTGIGEHLVKGRRGIMSGYLSRGSRLRQLDRQTVYATHLGISQVGTIVVVGVVGPALPVIVGHVVVVAHLVPSSIVAVNHVAVEEIAACHVPVDGIAFCIAAIAYADRGQAVDGSSRAALKVVTYHVDLATARTAVAAVGIVNHAVAEIDVLRLNRILPLILTVKLVAGVALPVVAGTVEARRTVGNVQNHVMVERS